MTAHRPSARALGRYQLASHRSFHWNRLRTELESSNAASNAADGAAANHAFAARHEAARKLITNHKTVLHDITRSDGPPKSQPDLERLPGQESLVDDALFEIASRLFGHQPGSRKRPVRPKTSKEAHIWQSTAKFLAARLQTTTEEVASTRFPERKPDMSKAAGAAMRAVLTEIANEGVASPSSHWRRARTVLESSAEMNNVANGAAANHTFAARHEAARKLVNNHPAVLHDITRSNPPPTQRDLKRLPGQETFVDKALVEIANRLLGHRRGQSKRWGQPTSFEEANVWKATAAFLAARLHTSAEEVARTRGFEARKPDMSPAAGAAMRAVLSEVSEEKVNEPFLNCKLQLRAFDTCFLRASRQQASTFWAQTTSAILSVFFVAGWFIFPVAWTMGPPGTMTITEEQMEVCYAFGDIMAKNIFAACGVILKHYYLQHLNSDDFAVNTPVTPDAESVVAEALQSFRATFRGNRLKDRRPSAIMMGETNNARGNGTLTQRLAGLSNTVVVNGPNGDESSELDIETGSSAVVGLARNLEKRGADNAAVGRVPSSTMEYLVGKVMAALEPLCARLCRLAGQPGFSLEVEKEEVEKMRLMCKTVLKLTANDDESGDDESDTGAPKKREQASAAAKAVEEEESRKRKAEAEEEARKRNAEEEEARKRKEEAEEEARKLKERVKSAAKRASNVALVINALFEAQGATALKQALDDAEPLKDDPGVAEAVSAAREQLRAEEVAEMPSEFETTMATKDAMSPPASPSIDDRLSSARSPSEGALARARQARENDRRSRTSRGSLATPDGGNSVPSVTRTSSTEKSFWPPWSQNKDN